MKRNYGTGPISFYEKLCGSNYEAGIDCGE